MGLFSNKKKTCPICDSPTPRLLATKVEDMPICKECAAKIDLPDGALNQMSLEDFREYIDFYEKNQALRDAFQATYKFDDSFFGGCLWVDDQKGLFRLKDYASALVLEASNLKSFRITEDGIALFEGSASGLKCYQSAIPERVNGMRMEIMQFQRLVEQYEFMERMEKLRDEKDDSQHRYHSRPYFEATPFEKFIVELTLIHPYWGTFRREIGAPTFSSSHPSIESYLRDYEEKVKELRTLAEQLMGLINPEAPVLKVRDNMFPAGAGMNGETQMAPPVNAVDEIKKYKELMDAGILTEEEFMAKKRQLLGI